MSNTEPVNQIAFESIKDKVRTNEAMGLAYQYGWDQRGQENDKQKRRSTRNKWIGATITLLIFFCAIFILIFQPNNHPIVTVFTIVALIMAHFASSFVSNISDNIILKPLFLALALGVFLANGSLSLEELKDLFKNLP